MKPQIKRIKFDDFSKGMMDSPDPGNLPSNAAQECNNVDLNRKPGSLCKAFKPEEYNFTGVWTGQGQIISASRFVYHQDWEGAEPVSKDIEMVVIQVVPSSIYHLFEWYEIKRTIDVTNWEISGPFYIGYDETTYEYTWSTEFKGDWGITWPGPIFWHEENGVLRAACGGYINDNESFDDYSISNSYPIQWRWVSRWPKDPGTQDFEVNGFFEVFDNADPEYGNCLDGYLGIWRGRSIPDFTPTLTLVENSAGTQSNRWVTHDQFGYLNSTRNLYVALAEYDGHQIAPLKHEPTNSYVWVEEGNEKEYTTKHQIEVTKNSQTLEYEFPKRLTAFRFYRASMNLGEKSEGAALVYAAGAQYGPFEEIYRVDIKDGVESVYSGEGKFTNISGTSWKVEFVIAVGSAADVSEDVWKNLFVKVDLGDGTYEEYQIDDSDSYDGGDANYGRFYFTVGASTGIASLSTYAFTVNSRWYYDSSSESVKIQLLDNNLPVQDSPPWLVPGKELDNQPKIECNYTKCAVYKDRLLAWGLYFDDIYEPLMIRMSNEINHPFAGYDIQPNYFYVNSTEDDVIKFAAKHLDWWFIFTKYKIFKYLISDSNMILAEQPWDIGLLSDKGIAYQNGLFYFWGREGDYISYYIYDGENKPVDVGRINRNLVTTMMQGSVKTDWAAVMPIPYEGNVLFNMPEYELVFPE